MRIPKYGLAVVAAAALTAAACGDDDASSGQADVDAPSTTTAETVDRVDDDTAAMVDGEEITAASIDEALDALAESPQFSEQLAGPEGDATRADLAAQVLSSAITTNIVSANADHLGRPVTDDDVAAARAELEEQVGGADALSAAAEEQGLTESLLELELTSLAAMRNVQEVLDEEAGDTGGDTAPDAPAPGAEELDPSEQRLQEHLLEVVAEAEVTVHEDYGVWDPQAARVTPPGGAATPTPGG